MWENSKKGCTLFVSPLRNIREENEERRHPFMAGKIFYRQRTKMQDGAHQPRYVLVAVADLNLKVYAQHLRM